jgi:dTDP-4-dehydrorhamnose 3,5-epimerase
VLHLIPQVYDPVSARGVRWNDPVFGITWPAGVRILSDKDNNYPDFVS